jgi:DNA-directed RNA polymerase specialized sigma24 family protein
MSHDSDSAVDAALIGERRHLLSLAFRMLGTVAEAEDAVQETYVRWYRLEPAERDQIQVQRAWLTRVASRICLDMLGTARARRERYLGPWLPEPVPTSAFTEAVTDPLDQVTPADSVSTALLVVLEAMTPAERVAFVLHDVFAVPFPEIAQIVGRTPAACVFRRGGRVTAARNPVRGADRVGRFLLGALRKRGGVEVLQQDTKDGLGFVLWDQGRIVGVITLEARAGRVSNVRMVLNPEKLTLWNGQEGSAS